MPKTIIVPPPARHDRRLGRFKRVATGGDERAVEDAAKLTKSHRRAERVEAKGEAVDDVEIGKGVAVEDFRGMEELVNQIAVGGMNLDAVEARRAGATSGKPIALTVALASSVERLCGVS